MSEETLSFDENLFYCSFLKCGEKYLISGLFNTIDHSKIEFNETTGIVGNGKGDIQNWMDKSNFSLRMYGSAEELSRDLNIYRSFTGAQRYFNTEIVEVYGNQTLEYKSLKGDSYICKQDIFHYLDTIFNLPYIREKESPLQVVAEAVFATMIRVCEDRLSECCEFVKMRDENFRKLSRDFTSAVQSIQNELDAKDFSCIRPEVMADFPTKFFVIKQFIAQLNKFKKFDYSMLDRLIQICIEQHPPHLYPGDYAELFMCCQLIGVKLVDFLGTCPHYFLPNGLLPVNPFPLTIRLFDDNLFCFVMVDEVEKTMKMKFQLKFKPKPYHIVAMKFGELLSKFPGDRNSVDLICTPIKRTKHQPVPILSPIGRFCILASDGFFVLLRDLIFGHKVFQKARKEDWITVEEYLNYMTSDFYCSDAPLLFFDLQVADDIRREAAKAFPWLDRPAKHVRNAKSTGFTLQNLKNELKNLELLDVFPEIEDYAEKSYEKVMEDKKEEVLRTCDLFDAVEYCQVMAIVKRFPEIQKFLHNQNACHRLVVPFCQLCPIEDQQNFEAMLEKKKTWDELLASQNSSENPPKKEKSPTQKSKRQSKSPEKVSKGCGDCLILNEEMEKLKKEMKMSQIQLKTLEKKIKEVEEEKKRKKEQLEELEEKTKPLEMEICDLKGQVLKIQREHRKFQETSERKQQELSDFNVQLLQSNSLLSEQLKSELQKVSKLTLENQNLLKIQQNSSETSQELDQKSRAVDELRRICTRLIINNEEKDRTIASLTDRLASATLGEPSHPPHLSVPSPHMRQLFEELKMAKDWLYRENPLRNAEKMAKKLIEMSDVTHIQKGAHVELNTFKENCKLYMDAVEQNIQRIQKNPGMSVEHLLPLPEFPSFSEGFMIAYEKVMKAQLPSEDVTPSDELEDKECVICLQDMLECDETMKCQNCRRRFHMTPCVTTWLQKEQTCPVCKRSLLDPNEFPTLS